MTTLNVKTEELKTKTKNISKHEIFLDTFEENKNKHKIKYMVTKQKE
jgi:hypothetical protein